MTSLPIRTQPQPRCPVTGQTGAVLYEGLTDRLWGVPGEWRLRANLTSATPTAWLDPRPVDEDLPKLYQRYYTHGGGATWASSLHPLRFVMRAAFAVPLRLTGLYDARLRQLRFYLDDLPPAHVLEVGCGRGDSLARLMQQGWHVEGHEMDERAAHEAVARHGFRVHTGALAALAPRPGGYDAVVMNHVIEHTSDPVGLLRRCGELLRPGGRLVCITPNILSDGRRRWERNWRDLDPPRHLSLMSSRALHLAAERAGLPVKSVTTSAVNAEAVAVGSEELQRGDRYDMMSAPRVASEMRAKQYQMRRWRTRALAVDGGEELVLEATR